MFQQHINLILWKHSVCSYWRRQELGSLPRKAVDFLDFFIHPSSQNHWPTVSVESHLQLAIAMLARCSALLEEGVCQEGSGQEENGGRPVWKERQGEPHGQRLEIQFRFLPIAGEVKSYSFNLSKG